MAAEELSTAQLRVLSHPTRLAFLRRLRENGPATSRSLGREFDLDSGAASYHLRRLAAGGLILEDPALGTRRERWWRATEDFSQFDPAVHDDGSARRYMQSIVLAAAEELQRVASAVPSVESAWLTESAFVDQRIALDGERRARLRDELMAVIDPYREEGASSAGSLTQVRFQIYEQR